MKLIALSTLTVAFYVSIVTSKITFGACSPDVPKLAWSDYSQTQYKTPYTHRMVAIDK